MASGKEFLEFVLEQYKGLSARAMMGEYVLYYGGKVVGGIYDNRLLIKPTRSVLALMPNAPMELALRESNPFGLKWKIDCITVLKKFDNSLIACTFLPCNPTYFLI